MAGLGADPVAIDFHGGPKKRPAFNVAAVAKAIVHEKLDQASETPATLLVYDFQFSSRRSTRIKDATVSFEFKAKGGGNGCGPTVTAVAPYPKHIKRWTTESVTTLGGNAGVQGGAVVTGNAATHAKKSI
ncbi:hypothetical protein F4818DRAFT_445752 [Hypoxylon cercidicola]|nr:hypothetical protein F4818DRAFT_445752 [Hypoxylon cercidicola]